MSKEAAIAWSVPCFTNYRHKGTMENTNRLSIPKVRAILEHSVPATVAAQLPPRAPPRKCYANNAAAPAADANVNGAPKPVGIVVAAHPQPTPMSTAANVTGAKRKSCDADSTPDAASAAMDIDVGSSCAWQELNVNANVNGAKRKSCDADSTRDARDYDQYSCVQPNADKPACKGSATAQLALDAEPMPAVHVRANADVGTILPATAKWVDVASVDACALSQVATMVKWTSRSRDCGGVAAEVESLVVVARGSAAARSWAYFGRSLAPLARRPILVRTAERRQAGVRPDNRAQQTAERTAERRQAGVRPDTRAEPTLTSLVYTQQ